MKKRRLGRTNLEVSEIGFGCWAIGGSGYGDTNDAESLAALETAWEAGVNFYDTADTYGHGHSEELVAQFLQGKPRDKVIVATKVGWDFYHGGSKKRFDEEYIRFACDKSFERLNLDQLDLYQLHNPKLEVLEKSECLKTLEKLKSEKRIRFCGVSAHKEEEALFAMESGIVDTLQLEFNLIDQTMARTVFDAAKAADVGIIIREPLANGLLTGKYSKDDTFPKTDHRRRWPYETLSKKIEKVDVFKEALATKRLSLTRAALEYILDYDAVSVVIPGAKTKAQIEENMNASVDPQLRIEESVQLRQIYETEPIFRGA